MNCILLCIIDITILAILEIFLFKESLSLIQLGGILLIVAGVLALELGKV